MRMGFLCIAALLLAGCSNEIHVYSDTDPDYDLWSYKTFNWGPTLDSEQDKNPLRYNEFNDKRIKTATDEQLRQLGYRIDSDHPDLILHYHIVVEDQATIALEPYGYFYGPFWMRMHTNVYPYREGTLIIDMMDAKTNNLVWRGWAVSAIEDHYTPAEVDHLIKSAVSRIFRKFPTRAAKAGAKEIVSN